MTFRISDSYRSSGSSGGGSSSNKNDRNRSRSPLKSHRSKDSSLRRNSHSPPPPHRVPSDHRSSSSSTSNDARQRTERNGRTHSSHSTKSDSPLAAAAAGRIESLSSTSLGLLFPGLYPTTAPRPADPQQNALASSEKLFLQHHPFPWSNPFQPDSGEQWRRLLLGASGSVDCDPTATTLNSDGLFADVSRLTPMDMMYRKAIAPPTALGGGGGGLRFPFRHLSASPGFLENTGIYPPSSLRLPLSARFPLIDPSVSSMYKLIADGLHPELR